MLADVISRLSAARASGGYERWERRTDTPLLALALLFVVVLALPVAVDLSPGQGAAVIKSLPDALWWAATTVTTVGYGDRYPTTTTGRLIAVGLMVVGIALLGVVTATIAAWFVARLHRVQEAEERTEATLVDVLAELREVKVRLDSIERQGAGCSDG